MDIYCTVLRFTPTKMGVAIIHQNARLDRLARVIPENGRPKHWQTVIGRTQLKRIATSPKMDAKKKTDTTDLSLLSNILQS